jgi:hypothetical protein
MQLNGQMYQEETVYGGATFRMSVGGCGLPESVEIYTSDQRFVVQYGFGIITPSDSQGKTPYVSLAPGDYIVIYTYYKNYTFIVSGGRYVCRGTGSPTVIGAILHVK